MVGYIEATYQAWSQGRSANDCIKNKEVFVALAAKLYCYSIDEMHAILETQTWYIKATTPDLDS